MPSRASYFSAMPGLPTQSRTGSEIGSHSSSTPSSAHLTSSCSFSQEISVSQFILISFTQKHLQPPKFARNSSAIFSGVEYHHGKQNPFVRTNFVGLPDENFSPVHN
jgi:hypothetical protein